MYNPTLVGQNTTNRDKRYHLLSNIYNPTLVGQNTTKWDKRYQLLSYIYNPTLVGQNTTEIRGIIYYHTYTTLP